MKFPEGVTFVWGYTIPFTTCQTVVLIFSFYDLQLTLRVKNKTTQRKRDAEKDKGALGPAKM
jgi:hypothetical protein